MSLLWCSQSYWLCRRKKDISELKRRPLEEIKFGGAGMFSVLTTCINAILENLPPFGQDLCLIRYHQCTVMIALVDGFYKKEPTLAKFAFRISLSFNIASMSANREFQELLREFE